MKQCDISVGIFEQPAVHCTKLKSLIVVGGSCTVIKLLFQHHYPTLEHLKYQSGPRNRDTRIDQLKIFLENHTNLKRFESDQTFLWANRDLLIEAEIQWNLLTIHSNSTISPFDQFFIEFVKTLHERNIYKTLHLSFGIGNFYIDIDNIVPTLPALEILNIYGFSIKNTTGLINLKELCIFHGDLSHINVEAVAKCLIKLERLSFKQASIDHTLPFIRHSKRLKTIKIFLLM